MLAPLLVQALEQSGGFRAVVQAPSLAAADLRLDSELVRLQQDFGAKPSRVRITVRAQLIDVNTRRVLATAQFDETEAAPSDDPYGGVLAANRALGRVLERLATFCAETPAPR
jgi:cholesterol transport system auxiliary component